MTSNERRHALTLAGALFLCGAANAGLGQDEASVESDRMHLQASRSISQRGLVRTHELRGPEGARVLQYVGPHGKVFAVSWDAPVKLDVAQLMGTSYDAYRRVAEQEGQKGGIQRNLVHNDAQLAWVSGGHLNHFWGYALRKNMVPAGFDLSRLGRE